MSRPSLVAFALGALCLAALVVLALFGTRVMPSYLGAWLFVLALPLGALPVLMGVELLDRPETPVVAVLRRLVGLMPFAAVLAVPVLLRVGALYPWLGLAKTGLPGWWMTPAFFILRAILFLALWTALALAFSRAPGSDRRGLAGFGLGLHLVIGTLSAIDWVGTVEPNFTSSALGLIVISIQCGIAVSLAVAVAALDGSRAESRNLTYGRRDVAAAHRLATALAVLLGLWGFMVFTQYLVVWSANLPAEVSWYRHRAAGIGQVAEYAAGILCAIALVCLLVHDLSGRARVLVVVAAAVVVMHAGEMMWLVTPAFRARFSLDVADILALVGVGGLGLGGVLMVGERAHDEARLGHGA